MIGLCKLVPLLSHVQAHSHVFSSLVWYVLPCLLGLILHRIELRCGCLVFLASGREVGADVGIELILIFSTCILGLECYD